MREVSNTVTKTRLSLEEVVSLGNLDARRDRGYAPEYVELIWQMLQRRKPEEYVVRSGEAHSVREFAQRCPISERHMRSPPRLMAFIVACNDLSSGRLSRMFANHRSNLIRKSPEA
jgi:nucleoside-diphosphate-sugar epimerase